MNSDVPVEDVTTTPQHHWHVQLLSAEGVLQLVLPTLTEATAETSWTEIWEQIQQRINGAKRFWQPLTPVHIYAHDRLLDARQLQNIAEGLTEVQLILRVVYTSRRQTAVAAVAAGYSVFQQEPGQDYQPRSSVAEPLYLQMTVRSGAEIRHPGTVVIVGDVNPGGAVIADGDIIVWGRLRGIAHAGSSGNEKCLIMALQMNPTQLRIANYVARSPEQLPENAEPEIAYVQDKGIRISAAADSKSIPALLERNNNTDRRHFM